MTMEVGSVDYYVELIHSAMTDGADLASLVGHPPPPEFIAAYRRIAVGPLAAYDLAVVQRTASAAVAEGPDAVARALAIHRTRLEHDRERLADLVGQVDHRRRAIAMREAAIAILTAPKRTE